MTDVREQPKHESAPAEAAGGAQRWSAALTPSSVAASVLGLLATAMIIQYASVFAGFPTPLGEFPLPLPAIWSFCGILALVLLVRWATRVELLKTPELLFVLYVLMIGAPLMTQGFWHRIVAITATIPRGADWEKIDAYSDKLWPRGPNLMAGGFGSGGPIELKGGGVQRVRVSGAQPGVPYMVTVRVRAAEMAADARYFVRAVGAEGRRVELASGAAAGRVTPVQPEGYLRIGAYGRTLPVGAEGTFDLEVGVEGSGRVTFADPMIYSVAALEGIYKGRPVVRESALATLTPEARALAVVKPDNMWSWRGVVFVVTGYVPWRDWLVPLLAWGLLVLCIHMGVLGINLLMQRQWIDAERFPLPLARIPELLTQRDVGAWLRPRANWTLWCGALVGLGFVLLKALHARDPSVMDPSLSLELRSVVGNPAFERMLDGVRFELIILVLALCFFMELNVLLSIVIGYWLFRLQHLLGQTQGWHGIPRFPFEPEQQLGAFAAYALVVLYLARRHLAMVGRTLFGGAGGDASTRGGVVLIGLSGVGMLVWAWWVGQGYLGMMVLFVVLLMIGLVASRLRTECGTPWTYLTPAYPATALILLGSISVFGPGPVLFAFIASFFMGPPPFLANAGASLEFAELSRRQGVRAWHAPAGVMLAVVGGLVIGGWVFLSNSYALGGDSLRYNWAYDSKAFYLVPFNAQLAASGGAGPSTQSEWIACGASAAATGAVAVARQFFAGFWFHPIGLILGSTYFAGAVWASALVACVVRALVLWTGGAAAVRGKLYPAAAGELMWLVAVGYFRAQGMTILGS